VSFDDCSVPSAEDDAMLIYYITERCKGKNRYDYYLFNIYYYYYVKGLWVGLGENRRVGSYCPILKNAIE